MADTTDGSSIAAQGAPPDEDPDQAYQAPTFLSRLLRRRKRDDRDIDNYKSPADHAAAKGTREMILNVRAMSDMRVEDVSVPRADIIAVPESASLADVVAVFRDSTLTRLPVFRETLDNPIGIVHLKDIALRYGFGKKGEAFDLAANLRPLLYAPPSMPMGVLLQKMQSVRIHMALVIDEYGGVDGLVTIEDLVEQIVGEIADEHDADEGGMWSEEAPGVYICQSRAPLDEFEQAVGVDLLSDELDEDVDTLGGLVFMLAGRVPARGEILKHMQGHEFEVIDADARRVKRLRVRIASDTDIKQAAE